MNVQENKGEIVIYQTEDGQASLEVRNGDEITSASRHHSFRPPLSDLKSQKP